MNNLYRTKWIYIHNHYAAIFLQYKIKMQPNLKKEIKVRNNSWVITILSGIHSNKLQLYKEEKEISVAEIIILYKMYDDTFKHIKQKFFKNLLCSVLAVCLENFLFHSIPLPVTHPRSLHYNRRNTYITSFGTSPSHTNFYLDFC